MALLSMGFIGYMLGFSSLEARPGLLLTSLLLLSLQTAFLALERDDARTLYGAGGLASFVLLALWTIAGLKAPTLYWGLGFYLAFAVVHCALPLAMRRLRPASKPLVWGFAAPFLMLALILVAMVACDILSFAMWPVVLLLGMLGVAVAWFAGSILAAGATLLLIMAAFGIWLFRLPDVAGLPGILSLLAVFSTAFFAWGLLVTRGVSLFKTNTGWSQAKGIPPGDAAQIPALAAMLPFALLALVCMKLKMPYPGQIFGLMALMNVLLLALAAFRGAELVSLAALVATVIVEYVWHTTNFNRALPLAGLPWYVVFYGAFLAFPFVMRKRLKTEIPWIAAALSGLAHFFLVYKSVSVVVGNAYIGLVPAIFALPTLAALYEAIQKVDLKDPRRNTVLAWFGGVALFFITIIIPLQFNKEWVTLGWALEGTALLWLFLRVPHPGLKTWGLGLLAIAFVRLALNPAVLSYHPRTDTPILNWYLLVYGLSAAAMFVSEKLLQRAKLAVEGKEKTLLVAGGTILLFLLLNIEIADYFSKGATITFDFSGNLARDLTYSLSWGLFAIAMLVAGIRQGSRGARNASLALLVLTILKVFLHDLTQLNQLYRVASMVGLAVMLMLVSFLYQKFLATPEKEDAREG
jgi:uncharacterized membrane protein